MRSVLEAIESGNDHARLALELFCYRLARAILGLTAGLERIDALVFTGGIGENSPVVRSKTLDYLAILRPRIDQGWNERNGRDSGGRITKETGLACFVIPTNEELMIARQTAALVLKGQRSASDDK
jgi:acetate kinase